MGKILHTSQHTYIYSHIHYNKITMARNPYELRMECLQMAEARLQQRFDETKQRYEFLDEKGIIQDPNDYPKYPTDDQIDELSDKLIKYISCVK